MSLILVEWFLVLGSRYSVLSNRYSVLWVNGMLTNWPDGDYEGSELHDQKRNDFGLSFRIGYMKRYGKFVVDWYAGAGIKYILLHQVVYGYYPYHDSSNLMWFNQDHSPDVYNKQLWGPVFNVGVKMGFAF